MASPKSAVDRAGGPLGYPLGPTPRAFQVTRRASDAARLNARVAVECDPVRRAERLADLRLAAAVLVAARVEVMEALLAGVPVPVERLDRVWVRRLGLASDVVLDDETALRVVACGPIDRSGR